MCLAFHAIPNTSFFTRNSYCSSRARKSCRAPFAYPCILSVYVRLLGSYRSTLACRKDPFRFTSEDGVSLWFVSSMASSHATWCFILTCSSHYPGWICSCCMYPCVLNTHCFRFLPRASRRVPFFTGGRPWIMLERPWTHQGETHHRRSGSAIGGTTSH